MTDTKHIDAKLRSRYEVDDGLAIFEFEPALPMSWVPGQYATLGLIGADGNLIERPYTICSSPTQGVLEFLIEKVPNGAMTSQLWTLKSGDSIRVRSKAEGHFQLDQESGRTTHLMVASITGIAPYVSMLRRYRADLLSGKTSAIHHFVVVHAGSDARERSYEDEFRALSVDVRVLRFLASTDHRPGWMGDEGSAEDVIRKYLDETHVPPKDITAYLCGDSAMIEAASGVLKRVGMPEENIRIEQYFKV